ncbi:MAG TPA: hypothetical protein VFP84_26170, partial [Kofleriaceae bacterium]|nr:hypothetical protein [Kofleriaceae bacterium]
QDPALPIAAGALPIVLAPPGAAELAAAIGEAFASVLTAGEVERVAAQAPPDLGAVARAAAVVAAQPLAADRVAAVVRALADQTGARREPERPAMSVFTSVRPADKG